MIFAKLLFSANVLVAGWISLTSMFNPAKAQLTVFEGTVEYSESIRLVGSLWFAIFVLSVIGLFNPQKMNLVFLFQFIYKGSWLLVVALPAMQAGDAYPKGMAGFFLLWVILLPFVIEWKSLFS